jgi:hypothetical protein
MNLWFKRTFNQERIGTRFGFAKDLRENKKKLKYNKWAASGLNNSTGPICPLKTNTKLFELLINLVINFVNLKNL